MGSSPDAAPRATSPTGPRFRAPVPLIADGPARWKPTAAPRSTTIADLNGDGRLDIFIADALEGAVANAVLIRDEQQWDFASSHDLAAVTGVRAAIWGDMDDDGLVDVVLCRGSGGTALWAALQVARDAGDPDAVVVVLIPDSGRNYLGKLYNDAWLREAGILGSEEDVTAYDWRTTRPEVVVRR